MKNIKIHLIAGARPNFMKIAPLYHELRRAQFFDIEFIHTGQHFDENMSDVFINDLKLPKPHYHLGVGGGSHAYQTARIMTSYEDLCKLTMPDYIIVVGDVDSTLACTIVGKKLNLKVIHLESGLRSFDRTMPEEINRIVTDSISDIHLAPSPDAVENLIAEGISTSQIWFVGNIMIDSFKLLENAIMERKVCADWLKGEYALVTIHRASNVDEVESLREIVSCIRFAAKKIQIIFPIHPRTKKKLIEFNLYSEVEKDEKIKILDPLSYLDFMKLTVGSKMIITDSGGIQEESTYLGIPCLTLRDSTERPITVTEGTNTLVTTRNIAQFIDQISNGTYKKNTTIPSLWDGKTASRIVQKLLVFLGEKGKYDFEREKSSSLGSSSSI